PALRHRGDARAPAPGGARRGGAARARVPPGAPAPSRRPRARRGRSERAAARARSGDGAADQRRGAPARVPVGVARPRRLSHGLAQRGPRDPQRAIRALTVRALECSGAPRDLGRDLGGALRAELRAAFRAERSLRGRLAAFRRTNAEVQLHSDLRRYFPHHAEWLEGLALGSGVSLRALVGGVAARSAPEAPQGVAVGAVSGASVGLANAVPRGAVLRRVAPQGRFRSVEFALPAATAPAIGVNEAGLAVAVAEQRSLPGRFAP